MIGPATAFDIPAKFSPPHLVKSSIPHPPVLTINPPFFRKPGCHFLLNYPSAFRQITHPHPPVLTINPPFSRKAVCHFLLNYPSVFRQIAHPTSSRLPPLRRRILGLAGAALLCYTMAKRPPGRPNSPAERTMNHGKNDHKRRGAGAAAAV